MRCLSLLLLQTRVLLQQMMTLFRAAVLVPRLAAARRRVVSMLNTGGSTAIESLRTSMPLLLSLKAFLRAIEQSRRPVSSALLRAGGRTA